MRRHFGSFGLLVCSFLTGCMAANAFALNPAVSSAEQAIERQNASPGAHVEFDPRELRDMRAAHHQVAVLDVLAQTPRGAFVGLRDAAGRSYRGTLLCADAETVELMNCIEREAVDGPRGKQCKTSHEPYRSFSTASLHNVFLLAPPDADDVPRDQAEDPGDVALDALVFLSGRRQELRAASRPNQRR